MKLYTHEKLLDKDLGKVDTPERDKIKQEVAEEIHTYRQSLKWNSTDSQTQHLKYGKQNGQTTPNGDSYP